MNVLVRFKIRVPISDKMSAKEEISNILGKISDDNKLFENAELTEIFNDVPNTTGAFQLIVKGKNESDVYDRVKSIKKLATDPTEIFPDVMITDVEECA